MNTEFICEPGHNAYEVLSASLSNGSDVWYEPFAGIRNDTGVRVNAYTALGNCHVWKALNVLAGDVGQLPIKLFRKVRETKSGKVVSEEVEGAPEINCLRVEPNPWMLPSVWKETAMWVAALRGNSLNWVYRPNPRTVRLIPMRQDRVTVEIEDELTGSFFFRYTTETGAKIDFDREEVLHIQGLSTNGIWGLDLIDIARNVIGQGLALEKYVNYSFKNGNRPSGVVKHPGKPSPEARANFRREWDEMHQGVENAHKIALLAEGMDYVANSMTMDAAQAEQLRRLDRQFVAELFNLPLFKLNSLENSSTRSNLEQQNQEYLQGSLMRWLNRFSEEFARKLLTTQQRAEGYYYRWMTEALLRGDTASRFSAYGVAIQNRIMNPNEAREKEDMPPYEGGDEYGNPNIDKKEAPEDAKAANDADNQGGRPPGSQSADNLIDDRLRQLIKAEVNCINRAASDSTNFVKWIDSFYSAKPPGDFILLAGEIMFPTVAAVVDILPTHLFNEAAAADWTARHAVESKRLLLKLCDQTTAERLVECVKEECETWNARAAR